MIVQSVHYTFAPEDASKAEAIFRELETLTRTEPGVLTFEVLRGEEPSNAFALWEIYKDRAALDAHRESEHFIRLVVNGIRPMAKERAAVLGCR